MEKKEANEFRSISSAKLINKTFVIDYADLEKDPNESILGKGAFGLVYKAKWRGKGLY